MHLFFGLGSFLTPLVTEKFQNGDKDGTFWNINNLYLMIGSMLGVSSFGFLYYYFLDRKFEYKSLEKEDDAEELLLTPIEEEKDSQEIIFSEAKKGKLSKRKRIIFILLMTSFNFFFAGVEGSFKNFIPAFASSCSLHLTRQEGSYLSGVFFGTYTVNRETVPAYT